MIFFPRKHSHLHPQKQTFACCCWPVALPCNEKATLLSGGESLWTLTTLFRLIIDFRLLRGISSDEFCSQKVTGNVSFRSLLSALWPIWFLLSLPDAAKYKQCSSCSWCQSSCDCYFPWLEVLSGLLTCSSNKMQDWRALSSAEIQEKFLDKMYFKKSQVSIIYCAQTGSFNSFNWASWDQMADFVKEMLNCARKQCPQGSKWGPESRWNANQSQP